MLVATDLRGDVARRGGCGESGWEEATRGGRWGGDDEFGIRDSVVEELRWRRQRGVSELGLGVS